VAVLASVAYFAGRHTAVPAQIVAAAPGVSRVPPAPEFFATITDADAAAEKSGIRIGQPLPKGNLGVPDHSKIGIAMRGGARLEVHGPAQLAIENAQNIRLLKGRVRTYAPQYAHGFSIQTEDGKAVDLGTRFVTAAGTGHGTEIHVLEGLVDAYADSANSPKRLPGKQAAILKDGKLKSTEYLEQRLDVPLDPVLADRDGDGFPDVVEAYYGTDPADPNSKPNALRFEESFASYPPGPIQGSKWQGAGSILAQGLTYRNNGKSLKSSGAALQTIGKTGIDAVFTLDPKEFPPQGVIYFSFLLQLPSSEGLHSAFGGLLLYQSDQGEIYGGKLSGYSSYGSRLNASETQDAFNVPTDTAPHLFVIRIDRTRLVSDVFMDPPLGVPESSIKPRMRYYKVPEFDHISVRSGSESRSFPVKVGEIRGGLTWDAVLPVSP
jgi:hypothetical protein